MHPGNIFFDEKGKPPITLIDLDMFMDSVEPEKNTPIGRSAFDFVFFKLWIAVLGQRNSLTLQEIGSLQDAFEKEYLHHAENNNPKLKDEIKFMEGLICTQFIVLLDEALDSPSHPWMQSLGEETMQGLIAFLLGELEKTEQESSA